MQLSEMHGTLRGKLFGNFLTKFVILDIKFRFTCGKSVLYKNNVKFQNIITRIEVLLEKLFFKSPLLLITFVSCKGSYLVEGFNARTRNNFFENVAVAKPYLIITNVQNKKLKRQLFQIYLPVKLAYGAISMKKGKNHLSNLQYLQFRQS